MENLSNTLENMVINFVDYLPNIISALVIFVLGLVLSAWITHLLRQALERRQVEPEPTKALGRITRWSLIGLFTASALNQVDFDLTAFLTGLGILGFTVGFALQDVSKNFFAGLLLLLQQPFKIGDMISVNEFTGTVTNIDMRATEIKSLDGPYILIPNTQVFTNAIVNFSQATERRIEVKVGVAYNSDTDHVRRTVMQAIQTLPGILADPEPEITFDLFGGSSLDLTARYWIDPKQVNVRIAMDQGIRTINQAFEKANIEIPFPTQSLLLPESLERSLSINGALSKN